MAASHLAGDGREVKVTGAVCRIAAESANRSGT
jgi:hypothetical protein